MTAVGVWEVYQRGLAEYNRGDLEAYVRGFAQDAVLQRPDSEASGMQAIRALWDREQQSFPDRVLRVVASAVQGDLVAAEWVWTGTNTGPLHGPDSRLLPPSGRRVELRGMEMVQFRGGLIVAYRMYWDHRQVRSQLGG